MIGRLLIRLRRLKNRLKTIIIVLSIFSAIYAFGAQELNYIEKGSGPTAVFLHGLLGSHRYWASIDGMLPSDIKRVYVDLLGFGASPKPNIEYTVDEHIYAINLLIKRVGLGQGNKLSIVGHSMGAILALNYGLKYPKEIDKIILVNPPIFKSDEEIKAHFKKFKSPEFMSLVTDGMMAKSLCILHELFPGLVKFLMRPYTRDLPDDVVDDIMSHTWSSYSGSLKNVLVNQSVFLLLKEIRTAEILILGSVEDEHAQASEFIQLKSQPNIVTKIVPGDHHLVLRAPVQVASEISSYLKK